MTRAVADLTTSLVEVPPAFFLDLRTFPDSLRRGLGPIPKDDLEHNSRSVRFSNLM